MEFEKLASSRHGRHLQGMDIKARDGNDVNSLYTMADALFRPVFEFVFT